MSILNRIRLRHIRCFLEVARLQSVVRAADALAISQPAVSKTLKELEEILGQDLFARDGRALRLNQNGKLFQQYAAASQLELQQAVNAVQGNAGRGQRLALGVLPSVAAGIIPAAALDFTTDYPEIRLRVATGPNWFLLQQLRDGYLDLVVGRMALPEQMAGLAFEHLHVEDVIAVVRPGHPLLEDPDKFWQRVEAYPLVMPPSGATIRSAVEQAFLAAGLGQMVAQYETVSLAFGRGIVGQSDAVWLISYGVVENELMQGQLRKIDLGMKNIAGSVGLTFVSQNRLNENLRALMDCIRRASERLRPSE